CSACRATIDTLAPACANTLAIPLPMPLLPPVTSTERPLSDADICHPQSLSVPLSSEIICTTRRMPRSYRSLRGISFEATQRVAHSHHRTIARHADAGRACGHGPASVKVALAEAWLEPSPRWHKFLLMRPRS